MEFARVSFTLEKENLKGIEEVLMPMEGIQVGRYVYTPNTKLMKSFQHKFVE